MGCPHNTDGAQEGAEVAGVEKTVCETIDRRADLTIVHRGKGFGRVLAKRLDESVHGAHDRLGVSQGKRRGDNPDSLDIGRVGVAKDDSKGVGVEPAGVIVGGVQRLETFQKGGTLGRNGMVQGMATPSWVRTLRRSTMSARSGLIAMACFR